MNILKLLSATALLQVLTPLCTQAQDQAFIGRHQITLTSDRMTPEALWAMGRIGAYAVSPDGRRVAYQVSYYDVPQNRSHTLLYMMNLDGTAQCQLTTATTSESDPAWICGGERLAYLSGGNLWSMLPDGSDRRQHTHKGDLEGFRFSPDGTQVCYIAQVPSTTSIAAKEADLPLATGRVINDMNYKHWDQYVETIPHLFVAPFDLEQGLGTPTDILEGEPYESPVLPFGGTEQFAWSPDSKQIAYTSRKKVGVAYAISTDTDIYLYDVQRRTTQNVCKLGGYDEPAVNPTLSMANQTINVNPDANVGYDQDPLFSPDGTKLAWKSMQRDGYESDRLRLCVLDLKTTQKTYVTESFESGVDAFCWAPDNQTLYFIGVWHARSMVYKTNLKGEVTPLTTGDFDYADLAVVPGGKQLVVKRHSISAPDDLYTLTPIKRGGVVTAQITHENDHILDQLALGEVRERTVRTTDDKDMLCWVIYPSHFDPAKKYPTLLFCEGGPQSPVSQFWSYRWNFQIMAANGYIIIAPNRRGLPGFGMEWLEEISGDYTGQCMRDYLSAIDDIAKESYVDRDHLGCIGASFGGYSVYWLAGNHDKRFKAFIAHDGIFNTQQQYYETEEMWFPNWDLGGAPENNFKAFTTSPHLYVDRWDTPILCIHGEKDFRILHSQGQAAFSAARMHGVDAQLLLFPDENHWVLHPQNGILWQRTFFRWLDKYLKP